MSLLLTFLAAGCSCPSERTDLVEGRACDAPPGEVYCPSEAPETDDYAFECLDGRWIKADDEGYYWAHCTRRDGECAQATLYIE